MHRSNNEIICPQNCAVFDIHYSGSNINKKVLSVSTELQIILSLQILFIIMQHQLINLHRALQFYKLH